MILIGYGVQIVKIPDILQGIKPNETKIQKKRFSVEETKKLENCIDEFYEKVEGLKYDLLLIKSRAKKD